MKMTLKNELIEMIDYIDDRETKLLLEIARGFIPDDVATPEDLADIAKADEEFARGEFVRMSDINWDA
jgi:hypothetical protein